jgi:transcription-repair coupling factor (superfamily II helicase)
MIDRFGLLPEPLKNLFAISEIKQAAEKLGILKIEANSKGGKIEFSDKPNIDPMKIIKLIQSQSQHYRLDGPSRLRFTLDEHAPKDRIELIKHAISLLES